MGWWRPDPHPKEMDKRAGSFPPPVKVVGGSASLPLAKGIAAELRSDLVDVRWEKHAGGFPDGEQYVRLLGDVRGEDVAVVQTTHPDAKLLELFLLVDAAREANARRVTAVVPYFGYMRQDRAFEPGESVSARALARRIEVGCDRVLTMGLHNRAILDFFTIPARDVDGTPALARYLRGRRVDFLLAPDENASGHAKAVAAALGVPWDFLVKERVDAFHVRIEAKGLAVRGKSVAIVDDIISTGTTIAAAAAELKHQGARSVAAVCLHGLFVAGALAKLKACDDVAATDTVLSAATKVTVAPEFAAALKTA